MAITTLGSISLKGTAGNANSIEYEIEGALSGAASLKTLSEASNEYAGSDRGAVATKDTDTAPFGMLEFSGYAHMSATETNYWGTTSLEADWAHESMSGVSTAHADVKIYVVYNGNTIELWGLAYGDGNSAGGAPDYFPPTANYPDLDNYNTWHKGYQVAFSASNPGYTVRYSYAQTSQYSSGSSTGFTHEGRYGNSATMTTSAVSIATSANQSLAVPNANVWWGRAHAQANNESSAQHIEIGVMTWHLEKTGSPTYTYARTIEIMATADSVGNGY